MRRSMLLLCLVLAAVPLQAREKVAALVETFENMKAGEAYTVQNLVIRQGSAEITLASGRAAIVTAGNQPVGLFFKGTGKYVYRTSDPDELPVVESNVKRSTRLKLDKNGSELAISDDFDQAFFWIAGAKIPDLGGSKASDQLGEALASHRALFETELTTPVAMHQYIQQRLDAPDKTLFRAEFTGGKENAVYYFDAAETNLEVLYKTAKVGGTDRAYRNFMVATPVSEKRIVGNRRTPPAPRFTLSALDYTLVADTPDAKLTITETITAGRDNLSVLRMDLYDRQWDDDSRERKYNVRKITDEKGNELSFDHRDNEILVGLKDPIAKGQAVKITFDIDGDFLIRPNGDNFWQLGVEPWFPQPDLGEQYYTVHSVVKVKKPYIAFAPGKTIRKGEEGDYYVTENEIDKPVQFTVVHAGKYSVEEETRKGVTVRVASYAGKNTRAMKQLTNLAFGVMEYYEHFLGPFPFPEFNIIEINTFGYGQAPPGTMFITKEAFNPTMGDMNQIFSQGINERFAHEIAHQYWGHVVKMPSGEEQWLTESFSEYSAAIFLKKFKGEGVYNSLIRHWKQDAKEASPYSSIATANRIRVPGDFITQIRARTGLIYSKGAYMLAALHHELGDQAFLSFLKSYQKSFRWKFGTSNDVAGLLEFITKKDYKPFMDKYYWGTEMPELATR